MGVGSGCAGGLWWGSSTGGAAGELAHAAVAAAVNVTTKAERRVRMGAIIAEGPGRRDRARVTSFRDESLRTHGAVHVTHTGLADDEAIRRVMPALGFGEGDSPGPMGLPRLALDRGLGEPRRRDRGASSDFAGAH
jgi:hypothetical protein